MLNHKAAADKLETFEVVEVDPEDRTQEISEPFEIEGWTHFTFDGRKDIAVATGNKGPKDSPTYDIYEQGEYGDFSQSYSLTELTKNYMGMFRVDNKQKALIVTNEVDCCTRIEERYRYNHDEYSLVPFYSRSVDTSDEDKVVVTETRTDRRGNEKTTTRTYTPAQWQRLNK